MIVIIEVIDGINEENCGANEQNDDEIHLNLAKIEYMDGPHFLNFIKMKMVRGDQLLSVAISQMVDGNHHLRCRIHLSITVSNTYILPLRVLNLQRYKIWLLRVAYFSGL